MNTTTVVRGDPALRGRPQVSLTPGMGVDVAEGWNVRGGVQLPVTRARSFDYNVILIVTRSFQATT